MYIIQCILGFYIIIVVIQCIFRGVSIIIMLVDSEVRIWKQVSKSKQFDYIA